MGYWRFNLQSGCCCPKVGWCVCSPCRWVLDAPPDNSVYGQVNEWSGTHILPFKTTLDNGGNPGVQTDRKPPWYGRYEKSITPPAGVGLGYWLLDFVASTWFATVVWNIDSPAATLRGDIFEYNPNLYGPWKCRGPNRLHWTELLNPSLDSVYRPEGGLDGYITLRAQ